MGKGNAVKKHERKMQRKAERESDKMYEKDKPHKREKYGTKSGASKFLHKYTGATVVGVALLLIFVGWLYHDSTLEEFEKFTCSEVLRYTGIDGLTDDQLVKWNKILAECEGKFTPP
tara:strand:- start:7021 stop:7371 length:351 start_codon:yes stop_codon:yes gene_type:complete